jgi:acyl carrier protein
MSVSSDSIRASIIEYILKNHVSPYEAATIPLDESLVELEVLDSYGVIELVAFLESNWTIKILDEEITREKMGSINKMVSLILSKL